MPTTQMIMKYNWQKEQITGKVKEPSLHGLVH